MSQECCFSAFQLYLVIVFFPLCLTLENPHIFSLHPLSIVGQRHGEAGAARNRSLAHAGFRVSCLTDCSPACLLVTTVQSNNYCVWHSVFLYDFLDFSHWCFNAAQRSGTALSTVNLAARLEICVECVCSRHVLSGFPPKDMNIKRSWTSELFIQLCVSTVISCPPHQGVVQPSCSVHVGKASSAPVTLDTPGLLQVSKMRYHFRIVITLSNSVK